MSRIVIKLSDEDIGNLLLGGTVTVEVANRNHENLQGVDIELEHCGSSSSEVEDLYL